MSQVKKTPITINEGKGHLDHPEDLVFLEGSSGALRAISTIANTAKAPGQISIKWDGFPALVFGHGSDGKFSILDKHMFNRSGGSGRNIYSPEQFRQYDIDRGADRTGLHDLIQNIWQGLEKASSGSTGWYWGDLLFSKPLSDVNGLYKFRANPNGITYTVDVDSDIGKLITNKQAGIAVHQYIKPDAVTTDEAIPLNGTIGQLKNNSNVAIVSSKIPVLPQIKINQSLLNNARATVQKYGQYVDQLFNSAPQARSSFEQLFTVYVNKKIVANDLTMGKDFIEFVISRAKTESMKNKLIEHLKSNKEGIVGAFKIWAAIYRFKMSVVNQLNKAAEMSPVKGYLQDGTQTQEGFVYGGIKFVDRQGFSAQNLAGRTQVAEDNNQSIGKKIVVMPGGFHPFHTGHMSLYNAAKKAFPDADVFVAATDSREERPFPFAIKEKLAKLSGVDPSRFIQVKSPFKANEITDHYDPNKDTLIFVRSEKDRDESPKPGGTKKDGTPSYFQPYDKNNLLPFSKHGYMAYLPTIEFGPGIKSASEIRKLWPTLTDKRKMSMVMSLYPKTVGNKELVNVVIKMLDNAILGPSTDLTESKVDYLPEN